MTFEEYYKSFGLSKYPFGVYTSEGERDELRSLFLKPENYSVILEGLRNTSAIVVGERGSGKTALSLNIASDLSMNGANLLVRVDEYSALAIDCTEEDICRFLTERIAAAFFLEMSERRSTLWKYSREERVDLSMYLHSYLTTSTKEQLKDKINRLQNGTVTRLAVGSYNFVRVLLNYGLRAATKVASDVLTKHFSSLPDFEIGDGEYFKRIESHIDESFVKTQREFFYLQKLCQLIKKQSFDKLYVLLDKIDEDPRFGSDAEIIGEFIVKFAGNNKLLTNDSFHVLLFVWSTPFNHVKSEVRTQKLTYQQLEWGRQSLEQVLGRRMQAYSNGTLNDISEVLADCAPDTVELIFEMCNRNPRDLWHILDKCFKEQYSIDHESAISDAAVAQGIKRFVTDFNYYEYYPKKASRANSMDVYAYIKHLLKLKDDRFTKDRLNEMAGTGSSTNNYVVAMENMGLVRKTTEKAQGGAVIYRIADPKVTYAMRHDIAIGS